jgi:hypothetical protein
VAKVSFPLPALNGSTSSKTSQKGVGCEWVQLAIQTGLRHVTPAIVKALGSKPFQGSKGVGVQALQLWGMLHQLLTPFIRQRLG